MSVRAREFIDASRRRAQGDRRRRRVIRLLFAALFLSISLGSTAWWLREDAVEARHDANANRLASEAARLRDTDPRESLQYSMDAYHESPTADARNSVLDAQGRYYRATLTRHSGPVRAVAFSRDGMLATGGDDGSVLLWDTRSCRDPVALDHGGKVFSLAFSPDGDVLATADGDGTIKLWEEVRDGKKQPRVLYRDEDRDPVNSLAFSPHDNSVLVGGSLDGTIHRWNLGADPPERRRLESPPGSQNGPINDLAFRPDGRILASANANVSVTVWNMESGTVVDVLTGYQAPVQAVAFSPDGRTLATGGNEHTGIWLWDIRDDGQGGAAPRNVLSGHTGEVFTAVFSPDGMTLATGGADASVRLWDVESGTLRRSLSGPTDDVVGVAFSPDSRIVAAAGVDSVVGLWNVGGPISDDGASDAVAFGPDGRTLATAGSDGTIRLWRTNGRDSYVHLWQELSNVGSPPVGEEERIGPNPPATLAFSPDRRYPYLAASAADGSIMLWDLYTDPTAAKPIGRIPAAHTGAASALAFSPDGRLLATAGPDAVGINAIKFWTIPERRQSAETIQYASVIGAVAFDETGRTFAAGGHDGRIILEDMESGAGRRLGVRAPIEAVAFSAGGRLAVAGSKSVTLWDWDEKDIDTFRRATGEFEHRQRAAFAVSLGDGGQVLASVGNDGTITLRNLATHDVIAVLGGRAGPTSLALSPDAGTLATIDDDGTPVLWDTDVRRVLDRIGASPGSARNQPLPFGCG